MATDPRDIVTKHRREIERSPGVGDEAQGYALAVCDDILADLEAEAADRLVARHRQTEEEAAAYGSHVEARPVAPTPGQEAPSPALTRFAEALRTQAHGELPARPVAPAWQPIETAPKDFTAVLLCWHPPQPPNAKPCVVMARWLCRTHVHSSKRHRCPDEADCQMSWDSYAGKMSHWLPLPTPPVGSR